MAVNFIKQEPRFKRSEQAESSAGSTGRGYTVEQQLRRAAALYVYGRMLDEFREHPEDMQRVVDMEPDVAMRTELRHMVDRVAFAREVLEFEPEPLQIDALRSWSRRIIFNCNRQFGKSTVCAIRALHRAWVWPGSLVLLVSRAHAQSGGVAMKIRDFLPILGLTSRQVRGDGVNRISIKFPNGSRIVALPGGQKPTRSHSSAAMVIIDEAAMVADPVHDAVTPTLARTNGELILASTPMGKRGAFYRAWMYGGDGWLRVFGPVDELRPGKFSSKFLKEERAQRGEDRFAQEYLCEFLDMDSHMFGEDSLQEVFRQDVESWE